MPAVVKSVGGRQVIASGAFIAVHGEEIIIELKGFIGYELSFKVLIDDSHNDETVVDVAVTDDSESLTVTNKRAWNDGSSSANMNQLIIGFKQEKEIQLNYGISFYGNKEAYAFSVIFTVVMDS